jgi:hypothetical protein
MLLQRADQMLQYDTLQRRIHQTPKCHDQFHIMQLLKQTPCCKVTATALSMHLKPFNKSKYLFQKLFKETT